MSRDQVDRRTDAERGVELMELKRTYNRCQEETEAARKAVRAAEAVLEQAEKNEATARRAFMKAIEVV